MAIKRGRLTLKTIILITIDKINCTKKTAAASIDTTENLLDVTLLISVQTVLLLVESLDSHFRHVRGNANDSCIFI